MKRNLLPVFILSTFLLIIPLAAGDVTFSQDKHNVNAGERFTWNLTFDEEVPDTHEIYNTSERIKEVKNTTQGNTLSLTFEVDETVEPGSYLMEVRLIFPGRSERYSTTVSVGVASEESLEEVNQSLSQRLNETEAQIRDDLEGYVQAWNKEITDLESKYRGVNNTTQDLKKRLDKINDTLEELKGKLQEKNKFNITGSLLQRGSIFLGFLILVALGVYMGYEKFAEEESSQEEPTDFSPE